jgi:hypothetical protein
MEDLEKCKAIFNAVKGSLANKLFSDEDYVEDLKICCKNSRYM